jgi:transposase
MEAVKLFAAGLKQWQVAERLNVSRTTVCRWSGMIAESGEAAMKARKTPGRPPALKRSQKAVFVSILRSQDRRWSDEAVQSLLLTRFGVNLSRNHCGRIMRSLGFRKGGK